MRPRFFHPYPKYLQVRDLLCRRIAQNLAVGDRLPTEHDLAAEFRVSRETIRAALNGLEDDGLIRRQARVGTSVAALPRMTPDARLTGLVEDFTALGLDTETVVLHRKFITPPSELRERLMLPSGQPAFWVERLRYIGGEPLAYHEAFMPQSLGEVLARRDLRKVALIHELNRLGSTLVEQEQKVEAIVADTNHAQMLKIALGAPLLVVTRLCVTRGDARRVLFRTHFRADRYYYTVSLREEAGGRVKPRKVKRSAKAVSRNRRPRRRQRLPMAASAD